MKWTKEKPTEPGWYWIVEDGFQKYKSSYYLIEVTENKGKMEVWPILSFPYTIDNLNVLWAGPVPEPE